MKFQILDIWNHEVLITFYLCHDDEFKNTFKTLSVLWIQYLKLKLIARIWMCQACQIRTGYISHLNLGHSAFMMKKNMEKCTTFDFDEKLWNLQCYRPVVVAILNIWSGRPSWPGTCKPYGWYNGFCCNRAL